MEQENKTITAYKGFDKDLKCRGFQYEIGEEYELPKGESVSVCSNGFHACESPLEVLDYYFMDGHANLLRFCVVEQSGEFSKEVDSTKVASSKIKIKKEITFADLINSGVEWLKEKNSNDGGGDSAIIASADNCTHIGSCDDFAKIGSSGCNAQIGSSGDCVQIASSSDDAHIGSSGYSAKIGSSGSCAQIGSSGNNARIASLGDDAKIGSSGGNAQIGSSGSYAQIGSSGNNARIASSGDIAQIASSGDCTQIASSGYSANIGSSGDFANIGSSGNSAKIGSSGNSAQICSSGNSAKIGSSGDYAQIDSTGEDSVIMCAGHNSGAKAKKGSWITLTEWYIDNFCGIMKPKCVKTEYVDGERIKEDTWYKLFDGEFVEV